MLIYVHYIGSMVTSLKFSYGDKIFITLANVTKTPQSQQLFKRYIQNITRTDCKFWKLQFSLV